MPKVPLPAKKSAKLSPGLECTFTIRSIRGRGFCVGYPVLLLLLGLTIVCHQQSVTVFSPGGAFWTVAAYPSSADPETLAQTAVEAIQQEYDEVEIEQAREMLAGHEMRGYDLNFIYLDMTNTARVRSLQADRATYTIFCQAEDREFAQIQKVFEAMATSLLGHISRRGHDAD